MWAAACIGASKKRSLVSRKVAILAPNELVAVSCSLKPRLYLTNALLRLEYPQS